jgi:hypothetical protein
MSSLSWNHHLIGTATTAPCAVSNRTNQYQRGFFCLYQSSGRRRNAALPFFFFFFFFFCSFLHQVFDFGSWHLFSVMWSARCWGYHSKEAWVGTSRSPFSGHRHSSILLTMHCVLHIFLTISWKRYLPEYCFRCLQFLSTVSIHPVCTVYSHRPSWPWYFD